MLIKIILFLYASKFWATKVCNLSLTCLFLSRIVINSLGEEGANLYSAIFLFVHGRVCVFTCFYSLLVPEEVCDLWLWHSLEIWAAACQNQQHDMCAHRWLRSAWASAHWSEYSLCAKWEAKEPRVLHADSEESDQTGRMPRLCVFAGHTVILLVLPCCGSYCLCFLCRKLLTSLSSCFSLF